MTHFQGFMVAWNAFMVLYNFMMLGSLIFDFKNYRKAKKAGGFFWGIVTDSELQRIKRDNEGKAVIGQWQRKFAWRIIKIPTAQEEKFVIVSYDSIFKGNFRWLRFYYEREITVMTEVPNRPKHFGYQRAENFFEVLKK